MDYLQYSPKEHKVFSANLEVLNLVINGLPSILYQDYQL